MSLPHTDPTAAELPGRFSHIGAPVRSLAVPSGHVVHFVDEGAPGSLAAVLIGGVGTSVRVFELTEFARDLRRALGIRVVCVERTGFGLTEFEPTDAAGRLLPAGSSDEAQAAADPIATRDAYAMDVLAVLDDRGVDDFAVIAISGGGPYAGELARRAGGRVRSVHLAAAVHRTDPGVDGFPEPGSLGALRARIVDPSAWWDLSGSPVEAVPGWKEAAYAEGAWAAFVRGQEADPRALALDYAVLEQAPPDVSGVTAPLFTYYGGKDLLVPYRHRDAWLAAYSDSTRTTRRDYPDEAHDVQYRHYDQILLDVAGPGDRLLVAHEGKTLAIPEERWPWYEARGAILGVGAWAEVGRAGLDPAGAGSAGGAA